ncbi:amino acid adenylation domain-containing protein [Fulvivirga maritima]|uniref:non-ribosomal peptide synthetase n=1 Tax=Fulvivirga maritima TaxID=2904247 RepID=UPI001F3A098A|nr:non-ribosomal peptide synthetase [Fulvivirga maritima]UII24645.1 amino acid adenylation domain-containing protein [Fulvivirga maritima]
MKNNTLIQVLKKRRKQECIGIHFIESSTDESFLSYAELYQKAMLALGFIQRLGVHRGDELVFNVDDNRTFITAFWACLFGGIIPVPITLGQNDDHKKKLFNIWGKLNNPYVLVSTPTLNRLEKYAIQSGLQAVFEEMSLKQVNAEYVVQSNEMGKVYESSEDDIAFIQFSSGSTGDPKGVVLTHKNLITNVAAISQAAGYSNDDSMISWMPLTHDMGLIGFHINPLFSGMNQYLMPTNLFVRRPSLWFDKVSLHKITVLCSPNFGYRYLLKHYSFEQAKDWELSSVRLIYNGAEPISVYLCYEFIEEMSNYGLDRRALCPVYGLAEASLAVSISDLNDFVKCYNIDRESLKFGDEVRPVADDEEGISLVNVGRSINDCDLRITDDNSTAVSDGVIGHVQIKGDNVTLGYYNDYKATVRAKVEGGWLKTGDLGFIKDGCLYITGRSKDIIFVNGQNFYPHDIERFAEQVEGVELNKIVVSGFFNSQTQKEEVVTFVFHRGSLDKFVPVLTELKSHIYNAIGFDLGLIIPVKDIPRTTSGKLQRYKLVMQYIRGDFSEIINQLNELLVSCEVEKSNSAYTEFEKKLIDICKEVLSVDSIDGNKSFIELGGNSLKAAEFGMILNQEFNIDLPINTLYDYPSIDALVKSNFNFSKKEFLPIPQFPSQSVYKLSSAQERLFYAWHFDKHSVAYNVPIAFNIKGKFDEIKLRNCFQKIINSNDALRMTFSLLDNNPIFHISKNMYLDIKEHTCEVNEVSKKLKELVVPFDLETGPLFRVSILYVTQHEPVLLLDFHHIIADGISIYKFIEELVLIYEEKSLNESKIGYKDYVLWESQYLSSEEMELDRAYWLDEYLDDIPILDLPTDRGRPKIFSNIGAKLEYELTPDVSSRLRYLARQSNCTLHVFLYTLYTLILSKYSGQNELVVGVPVAGRNHPDLKNLQGMFVNNLAIRTQIPTHCSFKDFLKKQKENLSMGVDHKNYPFTYLVNDLAISRDSSRNPLFDTMFVFQNMGFPNAETSDFTLTRHPFDPGFSKFDISMEVFDYEQSIKYSIEYAKSIFDKETILRFKNHFEIILNRVLDNIEIDISEISMLSKPEHNWSVSVFNRTESDYPEGKLIHELFEDQVKLNPDNVALECDDLLVSYAELNERADSLSLSLRKNGVEGNEVVAVLLPRSIEFVVAILGVLKAGCCYIPLDDEMPEERINYILGHSKCRFVVTSKMLESKLVKWQLEQTASKPCVIDIRREITSENIQVRVPSLSSNYLAYVIYTSGTTGVPKGVSIEHKSLVNYIHWASKSYLSGKESSFALFTPMSFDLTVTSIFTPLITGNKIVIYGEDNHSVLVDSVLRDNKSQAVKLTPSHLRLLLESDVTVLGNSVIERLIVGGEALEYDLAKKIFIKFGEKVSIFNEYGPTEATVGCMIHLFDLSDEEIKTVPIGVPADNMQIYLLDQFKQPVPVGVKGEIYIGGLGLARNYMFNDQLTKNKFIANPFVDGAKMFKTGDIARRLKNGTIEYIGRQDHQVKINGYRIELLEIENCLSSFPGVNKAVVLVRANDKHKKIIYAYFTGDESVDNVSLKAYVVKILPYYMIPSYYLKVDKIPLTKNGKIDYESLPIPSKKVNVDTIEAPRNYTETIFLKVWMEVFSSDSISITDNFFELGGDSIKAVQISAKLSTEGVFVSVRDILTYHTIEETSLHAKFSNDKTYNQALITGEKNLTPIESWFFSKEFAIPNYYNQSVVLKFRDKINRDVLKKAFKEVIAHHDGMRLNLSHDERKMEFDNLSFTDCFDVLDITVASFEEQQIKIEELKSRFNLFEGLLVSAAIFRNSNDLDTLFITCHHLVMDGVSWRIFLADLHSCYQSINNSKSHKLPEKTASLKDWYEALNLFANSDQMKKSEEYWRDLGSIDFSIPLDNDIDDWRCLNLAKHTTVLSEDDTSFLLKDAHHAYNTDVSILLNVALLLSLKEWTKYESFIIEHENHGRHLEGIDVSRTVGWFTSMYPVKFSMKDMEISQQILSVKDQMKIVPDYGIGYGIMKYMQGGNCEEAMSHVRFNYLGQFDGEMNNELFFYSHEHHGAESALENAMTAKLEMNLMIYGGELIVDFHYNRLAHESSTIIWFGEIYMQNLRKIIEHIKIQTDVHFSPSDFENAKLTVSDIDALFE